MQVTKDLEYLCVLQCAVERRSSWVSELGKLANLIFGVCKQLKELHVELLRDVLEIMVG